MGYDTNKEISRVYTKKDRFLDLVEVVGQWLLLFATIAGFFYLLFFGSKLLDEHTRVDPITKNIAATFSSGWYCDIVGTPNAVVDGRVPVHIDKKGDFWLPLDSPEVKDSGKYHFTQGTIPYNGLTPGKEYVAYGILTDTFFEMRPIIGGDKKAVVVRQSFTPDEPSGEIQVTFAWTGDHLRFMRGKKIADDQFVLSRIKSADRVSSIFPSDAAPIDP